MDFKVPDTPEELFRQGKRGLNKIKFGPGIPFLVVLGIIIAMLLSSFYSIGPDEVGVIRRFGKFVRITDPGLHWKLPFQIERLNKVPVTKVLKDEFGFRTLRAGVKTQYASKAYHEESLMLTGDLNVLNVTWIVQFKVRDPVKLLFNIRNVRQTVRDISESVMRQVIGDSSVTEALTTRRIEINQEVQERMQAILDEYQSGIQIETVKLQDVNPPDAVKRSFNAVNEAKQEKEKVINESWEAYNKVIPKAKGEAEKTIREAEGYALSRINKAKGDATKFLAVWGAYKNAKDVTKRRLYLEALAEVLPKAGKIYVFEPEGSNVLPLLKLKEGGK